MISQTGIILLILIPLSVSVALLILSWLRGDLKPTSTEELIDAQRATVAFYEQINDELLQELARVRGERDECWQAYFGRYATKRIDPRNINQPELVRLIDERFDEAEMSDLVFSLGHTQWRNLPGSTAREKATELVQFYFRIGLLDQLLAALIVARPNFDWSEEIKRS